MSECTHFLHFFESHSQPFALHFFLPFLPFGLGHLAGSAGSFHGSSNVTSHQTYGGVCLLPMAPHSPSV